MEGSWNRGHFTALLVDSKVKFKFKKKKFNIGDLCNVLESNLGDTDLLVED